MNNDNYFKSDDLFFVATALIMGKSRLERVTWRLDKPGRKYFYLSPEFETYRLFRDYISGKLSVEPTELNAKMAQLRRIPVEGEK